MIELILRLALSHNLICSFKLKSYAMILRCYQVVTSIHSLRKTWYLCRSKGWKRFPKTCFIFYYWLHWFSRFKLGFEIRFQTWTHLHVDVKKPIIIETVHVNWKRNKTAWKGRATQFLNFLFNLGHIDGRYGIMLLPLVEEVVIGGGRVETHHLRLERYDGGLRPCWLNPEVCYRVRSV